MKKFTKLWQLMMVLLLSSSIVFAQKGLDEKVSSSSINPGNQAIEKYADDQVKALEANGLLENGKVVDQSAANNLLDKVAAENPPKSVKTSQEIYSVKSYLTKPTYVYNPGDYPTPKQGGEDIANAVALAFPLPITQTGTTTGYVDDYDEICPYNAPGSPDVVYSITTTVDTAIDIDMLGSLYDTKIYVYEDDVTTLVDCNDDFYPDYVSALFAVPITVGHTYYIVIDGYGGAAGDYTMTITGAIPPPECAWGIDIIPPTPNIAELETCGDTINDGCNLETISLFQPVPAEGATIVSTCWAEGGSRDTDWYELVLTETSTVTVIGGGDEQIIFGLISGGVGGGFGGAPDCDSVESIAPNVQPLKCTTDTLDLGVLNPGTYWFFGGMLVYDGYPCDVNYYLDFQVEVVPCPPVSNAGVTLITETTARATWNTGTGGETMWNVEYGPGGFTQGTGTLVTGHTNTNPFGEPVWFDFSGLTAATYYDYYVQADCGTKATADWVGPVTFLTSVPNAALPVMEDFDTPTSDFHITASNPASGTPWVINNDFYVSDTSSAYMAYANNDQNYLDLLVDVDLAAFAPLNAQLTFQHQALTEGEWDHCFVEVSTDGGVTFDAIPEAYYFGGGDYTVPGQNNDPPNGGPCFDVNSYPDWGSAFTDTTWKLEKFNLAAYNTFTEVTFRFRFWADGSVTAPGWLIDDIKIEELACLPVSGIGLDVLEPTTATVSWTSPAGLSNFEWGPAGFVQGTGTLLTGVTSPQVLAPLMGETVYDVYIQDDCGGSTSDWVPFSFTTTCTDCPVGSIPEAEPCGDSTNNGCGLVVPAFTTVTDGVTICGNTWDDGSIKDVDYYQLDLATGFNKVTVDISGDVDMILGLLQQTVPGVPGCDNTTGSISPFVFASGCDTTTLEVFIEDAGTYYFWIAKEFWDGNVCPGSRYWASWDVEQLTDPLATIAPASFDEAVPVDGTALGELTIENGGEYPLTYTAQITNYGLGSKGASKDALFSEDFESGVWPPAGWSVVNNGGTCDWNLNSLNADIANLTAGSGDCAEANSDLCGSGTTMETELISPAIDLSGYSFATVTFANFYNWLSTDFAAVDASIDGGTTWTNVVTWTSDIDEISVLSLDAFAGEASVILRWHYVAPGWDWYWQVDDVLVEGLNAPSGWVTVDGGQSTSGAVLASDTATIAVVFDAAGLAIGNYTADIEITTNEPASDALYTIPVALEVSAVYNISGTLTYANLAATPMDLVEVVLMDGENVRGTTTTDEFGAFSFDWINGNYSYMATTTKPRGGTDVGDLNVVIDHIIGVLLVGLPFDAADVALDIGIVDVQDLNGLIDDIIGANPVWPVPDYLFTNPPVVVADGDVVVDFVSLCSGDPDGSFIPPNFCPPPTDIAITNLTATSGDVTWTSGAGLSNVEYGPTGFVPGAGTVLSGVTSPVTISGTGGDVIDVYVQDDCGGLSQSDWVGPVTFTIPAPGAICETAISIPALPYTQIGLTTCGFGDDYSSTDACGSLYMGGDDFVFEYTPAADITIDVTLTNTDTYVGVFVTEGCPDVGTCVANGTSSSGNPSLTGAALTSGVTYYIIVSTWPLPQCTPFDIVVDETPAATEYCITGVGPTSTADSNVEQVDITGDAATAISHTGCPGVTGVEDLTAQSVTLTIGNTYNLDVTFGSCGGDYAGAGEVWIDWNGDLDFNDPGESVGSSSDAFGHPLWSLGPVSFSITVPAGAVVGTTRMRVTQQEGGSTPLAPCNGGYSWGSVMDFTVNVQ